MPIDTIFVTITEPEPGKKLEFDITYDEGNGYTAYVTEWYKVECVDSEEDLLELYE